MREINRDARYHRMVAQKDPQILLVDDDLAHATSVQSLLAAHDFASAIETDGAKAISRLCDGAFRVLILDLNMPGTTGFDVLAGVAEANLDVKSIVLSGESAVATVTPILRLGAYEYLTKPFEPQQLLTSVANALGHFELERQNQQMAAKV